VPQVASADEIAAMRRALDIGAAVAGGTSPNPPVGAVVLDRAGEPAGEGGTRPAGQPHAEVVALAAAGDRGRGGTAVVTLEPCAHTGRTGPCVEALLAAGIARVVYAVDDPHPVAAGGADRLRAAGVQVEGGVLADEARYGALEPWLFAVHHHRPFVTWKFASTLDGRVAAADGSSQWITGPAARADVHRLRATVDAIAVGVGTVLADDPVLTVRAADGTPAARQPLRVVFDTRGRTPATARVLGPDAPTLLAVGAAPSAGPAPGSPTGPPPGSPTGQPPGQPPGLPTGPPTGQPPGLPTGPPAGVAALVLPVAGGRLDVLAALRALYDRGVRHLLLEGGPVLAGGFTRAGCVDQVVGYFAPALLGAGPGALGAAGIGTIGKAMRLDLIDVAQVGEDVRVRARPRGEGSREASREGSREGSQWHT
jgi:diaminohydroxyphosphoribosylaminopyrimidine deaminase/5-amino-6-(5-phosphoribosylamino)uracil reductase